MKHPVSFILRGFDYGGGEVEEEFHGTAGVCRPSSMAFVCPECGDLWARVKVDGAKTMPSSYPCDLHEATSIYSFIPGSLWIDWETELMKALPLPLLLREFELQLAHWEKFHVE